MSAKMKFPTKLNVDSFYVKLIFIFCCYNYVSGEDVRYQYCDATTSKACRIMKVNSSPCPEALKNEPCQLHKGAPMVLTFTFIPNFSANYITLQGYGSRMLMYVPNPDQDRNGCKFTKCPISAGQQHTLVFPYNITRSDLFLPGNYNAKWKIWNTHKPSEECCFFYRTNFHN